MSQRKIFGYPRSFLRFILLSYGLVSLPILIAALYAAATMNTLSQQNTQTVLNVSRSSRLEEEMLTRLTEMERALRQYAVLGDPALLGEFRNNGQEFAQLLKEFRTLHETESVELSTLDALVRQAVLAIEISPGSDREATRSSYRKAAEVLARLERALPDAVLEVKRGISSGMASNEDLAVSTQASLLLALFISVLAAALIVLLFRRLISTQLHQFEHAIELLGAGQYGEEIRFSGPEDIRFLGEHLEWLRLRLRELEAQRHRFLRNVSHDLKTPLTVLREGSQLLSDEVSGSLNPQQRHIVNLMNENGGRLQRMIEDLLRAQQASLAVSGIVPQPVRLDLICKQVLKDHQLVAAKRQIALSADLSVVTLEGVEDNLHKVVDNLVSNAIKYSPEEGRVRVRLGVAGSQVTLTVSDDGPGIPEEEKESVFEPFFRGAYSRAGRIEGSGVGLAISRDYVTAHGGTLRILPSIRGACLQVRLPCRQAHGGQVEASDA